MPADGQQHALVAQLEALGEFERAERAVQQDGLAALDGVDLEAARLGVREQRIGRPGAAEVVPLRGEQRAIHVEPVRLGEGGGDLDDAVDVREQARWQLGPHACSERAVVHPTPGVVAETAGGGLSGFLLMPGHGSCPQRGTYFRTVVGGCAQRPAGTERWRCD